MPDIDTWTPADDALVRSALDSLRAETDTLPLADPRAIRARGALRRRRALRGWAAGAAAAVVVAATVGYAALGRDGARPVPPAMTTATTPSPTSTGPEGLLATASPLPLGAEWQQALGLAAAAVVQPQPAYEGNLCQTPEPGSRRETQRVVRSAAQPDATLLGVQTRYTFVSDTAAQSGVGTLARGIASCAAPVNPRERTTSTAAAHPRIWSYTKDGATGWLALAHYGTSVAWLEVSADAPGAATVDQADMATLADIAYQRLLLYGAPAAPKPGITTPPPRAVDEDMPVTGPQPALSSSLFVAASQWASTVLTGGQRSYAGPGDPEGSSTIVQCETDQKMTTAGRYGIVSVRSGPGDANYIGKQRVRLFEGGRRRRPGHDGAAAGRRDRDGGLRRAGRVHHHRHARGHGRHLPADDEGHGPRRLRDALPVGRCLDHGDPRRRLDDRLPRNQRRAGFHGHGGAGLRGARPALGPGPTEVALARQK